MVLVTSRSTKIGAKESPMNKHRVELTQEQRQQLEHLTHSGTAPARHILHAHVLLKADSSSQGPDWSNEQIQQSFGVSPSTIWRIRQRFLTHGLQDAVNRRPQPERPEKRKLTGAQEAHLIALCCGPKPNGQARWSLRLLADKLVQLAEVDEVSYETVRRTLKKTNSSPG